MDADRIIRTLALEPHPEGGFYRQTFRSARTVETPWGPRAASTNIYYLLPAGGLAALHVVRSDETWHHYAGAPVTVHLIDGDGASAYTLGGDVVAGQVPQVVIPAGVYQATVGSPDGWALCGCTVAPGFDFADWELPSREKLNARFPQHGQLIATLTRPENRSS